MGVIRTVVRNRRMKAKIMQKISQKVTDEWTKQDELKQYHTYAEQLKKLKTTLLNCLEHTDIKDIQVDIQKQIVTLDKRLKKIHDKIDVKLQEQANSSAKIKAMENIAGVGTITSRTLLIWMPELGTLNRQTAAALAGLAPYNPPLHNNLS